jgi:hypothetical protein
MSPRAGQAFQPDSNVDVAFLLTANMFSMSIEKEHDCRLLHRGLIVTPLSAWNG